MYWCYGIKQASGNVHTTRLHRSQLSRASEATSMELAWHHDTKQQSMGSLSMSYRQVVAPKQTRPSNQTADPEPVTCSFAASATPVVALELCILPGAIVPSKTYSTPASFPLNNLQAGSTARSLIRNPSRVTQISCFQAGNSLLTALEAGKIIWDGTES